MVIRIPQIIKIKITLNSTVLTHLNDWWVYKQWMPPYTVGWWCMPITCAIFSWRKFTRTTMGNWKYKNTENLERLYLDGQLDYEKTSKRWFLWSQYYRGISYRQYSTRSPHLRLLQPRIIRNSDRSIIHHTYSNALRIPRSGDRVPPLLHSF